MAMAPKHLMAAGKMMLADLHTVPANLRMKRMAQFLPPAMRAKLLGEDMDDMEGMDEPESPEEEAAETPEDELAEFRAALMEQMTGESHLEGPEDEPNAQDTEAGVLHKGPMSGTTPLPGQQPKGKPFKPTTMTGVLAKKLPGKGGR